MKRKKKIYWVLAFLCLIGTFYFGSWWYAEEIRNYNKHTRLEPILFSLGFSFFMVFFTEKAIEKGK